MNKKLIYLLTGLLVFTGCTEAKRVNAHEHFWCPNSFTPNGDGLNEGFNPMPHAGILFNEYHLVIFDENLQKVFESRNISEWWYPLNTDQNIQSGFYEYQIMYNCSVDSVNYYDYITSSSVNLIR